MLDEHAVPSADESAMILTEDGIVIQSGVCPECEKVDRRIQSWRRKFWKCNRCKVEYAKIGS